MEWKRERGNAAIYFGRWTAETGEFVVRRLLPHHRVEVLPAQSRPTQLVAPPLTDHRNLRRNVERLPKLTRVEVDQAR